MNSPVTSKEMKEIERLAAEGGLPYIEMMENAGKAAANEIIKTFYPKGKVILIAVGKGNNGGDGYVVARHLANAGALTIIIMAEGKPATPDAITNYERCIEMGIEILPFSRDLSPALFEGADLIVDAIYGAGFHGDLSPETSHLTKLINEVSAKVIALDLPSGLNADTGEFDKDAVIADTTVIFAKFKHGHLTPDGLRLSGKMVLTDIGI